MKILFVCSQNRVRSLTGERIFDGVHEIQARSAGTEQGARVRVTPGLLGWADTIFVMEKRHAERLWEKFGDVLAGKPVVCLHITSDCTFMDPELVHQLVDGVAPYLDLPPSVVTDLLP